MLGERGSKELSADTERNGIGVLCNGFDVLCVLYLMVMFRNSTLSASFGEKIFHGRLGSNTGVVGAERMNAWCGLLGAP